MADNVAITAGTGTTIGADEIAAVKYQRIKMILGADGTNDGDVSSANPMPVSLASVPSHAVTGPLTDTQLRATAVPVSGTVTASGPVTDTQLRATPVPVSGTVTTGGLTDTQLRATAVPISGTVTATGPLTDTQIRATALPVSGTITANAGTNLNTSGLLTDTQLRATALPVSGTVAVTNAGITSIDGKITACNTGAVVLAAGTAEIGKLAAGTALIGKVGIDQATANANEVVVKSITAGDNNIGNVDIVTMPTNVPTTIGSGTTSVTTAGTRVALAGSTACRKVTICAKDTNTGKIFYGGNAVSATSGAFLYAGGSETIEISNLSSVYIDSSVNGEGVQYTYVA